MMDLRLHFLISILVVVLPVSQSVAYRKVSQCPERQSDWEERGVELNCNFTLRYHCLLTWTNELGELCYTKRALFPEDGCPRLEYRNKDLILNQYRCPVNVDKCPEGSENKGTFSTADLYKYPGCFETDRTTTTVPRTTNKIAEVSQGTDLRSDENFSTIFQGQQPGTEQAVTDGMPTKEAVKDRIPTTTNSSFVYIIGGGVVGIVILSLVVFIILQSRNIKQFKIQLESAKYMSSVPYNATTSHPYHEADIYDDIMEAEKSETASSAEYVEANSPVPGVRIRKQLSGTQKMEVDVKVEPEEEEDRLDYIDVIGERDTGNNEVTRGNQTKFNNADLRGSEMIEKMTMESAAQKRTTGEKYQTNELEHDKTSAINGQMLVAKSSARYTRPRSETNHTSPAIDTSVVEIDFDPLEKESELLMDKDDYLEPWSKRNT